MEEKPKLTIYNSIPESYNYPVYSHIPILILIVNNIAYHLSIYLSKRLNNKIDTIYLICRGTSGLLIASFLEQELNKIKSPYTVRIRYIRKPGEASHHDNTFSYQDSIDKSIAIIVDDFISTGNTLREIRNHLMQHFNGKYYSIVRGIICKDSSTELWKNVISEYFPDLEFIID